MTKIFTKPENIFKSLASLILTLALSGAAMAYDRPATQSVDTGNRVVVDSILEGNIRSRLYMQNGQIKEARSVYETEPYCYFKFSNFPKEGIGQVEIMPDEFVIKRVSSQKLLSSAEQNTHLQLASFGFGIFGNGGGSQYTLATQFNLESSNQPDITSLVCGIWADPRERRHLSFKEIKTALGDLAKIETSG